MGQSWLCDAQVGGHPLIGLAKVSHKSPLVSFAWPRAVHTVHAMSTTPKRSADAVLVPAEVLAGKPFMTMTEVCELLDETRSTIDKWRARGLFPKARRKPNGNLMWVRSDVVAFIDGLEVAT
jgi:predicted DNA-binding transcriptional regulator AlpA